MSFVDRYCPDFVGARKLSLSLAPELPEPKAGRVAILDVDYSATFEAQELDGVEYEQGPVYPLVAIISGPTPSLVQRIDYTDSVPDRVVFVPKEPGRHTVLLSEAGHNHWFGTASFDVGGDAALELT